MGSDLPERYCSRRLGRTTSKTFVPSACKKRVSPAPKEPVPSIPTPSRGPNPFAQSTSCENLNGGVPGWSDPNPQGPRHVPSERFVGQTGDVVTAPLRAGRDFIGECAFDQEGLLAVVSALLRLSSEREQLLIDL